VARAATADTVLVPGLDTALAPQDPGALAAIAEAARNGARLVSLCAGAFVLGQAYANDMSRLLVSPPHRSGGQSQYTKTPAMPPNGSLAPVMAWIIDHLTEPLTLESVAAEAHMSSRTLARRFRAETGDSVQDWIALRRVELARGLLEDSAMTISQIAYAAGFGSTESLRRRFRAATGASVREYRQAFSAKADSALA
jgi:AraC family transcriptional regulator, transcriptional activator FtrA